jgi:Tol biopolymer transport system component
MAFGAPVPVPGLIALPNVADASLSPDELVIVYGAGTVGGQVDFKLYFATRASTADAFAGNQMLVDLESSASDGDPALSHDGCSLYFSSSRSGMRDLFVADVAH